MNQRSAMRALLLGLGLSAAIAAGPAAAQTNGTEAQNAERLPEGFVYLQDVIPDIRVDLRYYGSNNFVGTRIDGYEAPVGILSRQAAEALKRVDDELDGQGYDLLVLDAYRPAKAVEHFKRWANDPEDTKMKERFYPGLNKKNLFKLGYIASRSGHSRGATVDLTLVSEETGKPVDMGGTYDFFGDVSRHGTKKITKAQAANRKLLKAAMEKRGFEAYAKEWWHYTLSDEPFPDTYFDFDVDIHEEKAR